MFVLPPLDKRPGYPYTTIRMGYFKIYSAGDTHPLVQHSYCTDTIAIVEGGKQCCRFRFPSKESLAS